MKGWLNKIFGKEKPKVGSEKAPAADAMLRPVALEPNRVSGETMRTYIARIESEAARTGNAQLASRARHLRMVHQ